MLLSSSSRNDFVENPDDGTLDERNLCHDVDNGRKRGEKEEYDSDIGYAKGALCGTKQECLRVR